MDDPEELAKFWASNYGPANIFQNKVTELGGMYPEQDILGAYMSMGRTGMNFAQHFADANLRAIQSAIKAGDVSKQDIASFNKMIRDGWSKINQKTGKREYFKYPEFAGIEKTGESYAQMMLDPELRKWFNDRMKTGKETAPRGLPSGVDIEYAISEPALRNLEHSLVGYSVGKMQPGRDLISPVDHATYSHGIPGRAVGRLAGHIPARVAFSDASKVIAETKRPQDFTGTIQKVFPHQVVDQQWQDEIGQYLEYLKRFTGKKKGGQVTMAGGGALSKAAAAAAKRVSKQLPQVEGMVEKVGDLEKISILPVPNRWFLQPDKFPKVQSLIETILETTGKTREDFGSGAFVNPRTGEILDGRIMNEVGVVINPTTKRPMMSGLESGLETLDPKLGSFTKSNLVRQSLFKSTAGDPLLSELPFIATIEKGGPHFYGISTEYASPTELYNTMRGDNPTLRPRSRGDLFGVGDVIGRVKIGAGPEHDVYEKLFVAPKGSDVEGKLLKRRQGGKVGGLSALRK
jgi:hypothetical protein